MFKNILHEEIQLSRNPQSSSFVFPAKTVRNDVQWHRGRCVRQAITSIVLVGVVISLFAVFTPNQAYAAALTDAKWPDQTRVGIHNAYDKSRFKYFIDALESGAGSVEVDVWQDYLFSGRYVVSDSTPLDDNNNCESVTSYAQLRSQNRNQGFTDCLNDMGLWQAHNPNHPPMILKLELKNGFETSSGYSPAQLDALLTKYLGASNIFTPANLMGSTYANPDSAARADAWPTASQLTGKIIVLIQAGAYELRVKSYLSPMEYIDYMISLQSAGKLSQAMAFPLLLGASATDPRPSGVRAPWYIAFADDASNYASLDTSFYYNNHYILFMTKAEDYSPAIGETPSYSDGTGRIDTLAAKAASVCSVDWTDTSLLSYGTVRS
jgi:hypothetical protein